MMPEGKIEAVIFDWGGVLIDDPASGLMEYCAEKLRVSKEDYIEAHNKFADDFQTNKLSEDVFWEKVCGELGVSRPGIDSLWGEGFAAVYVEKVEIFSLAGQLRKNGYRTALLSNTELPAMRHFHKQGYEMFDELVFSCAEGVRKPDREIYELAVERLGCEPERTVFIDDKQEYIKGAEEAGLRTIVFEDVEQVKNELGQVGVKAD